MYIYVFICVYVCERIEMYTNEPRNLNVEAAVAALISISKNWQALRIHSAQQCVVNRATTTTASVNATR